MDGIEEMFFYMILIKFIIKNNLYIYKVYGNFECCEIIFYLNGIGNMLLILKKSV